MPSVARFHNAACRCGGSIRVGPLTHRWLDPYEWFLGFRLEEPDIAAIEGLTRPVSRQDYRDIIAAVVALGLRPAMWRVKKGREPYRVMCAIPRLQARSRLHHTKPQTG